ncbi:peptidoglycan-binding domain-containing protein [Falsiroseomonas sp. E2-1-a20]|uniref:peptidoglycan-binding domain-containing protein n=1 Tax=Falsiroseomonas sp. E2-1-a20 TaxID=3239300 RepID=UPI003F2AD9AA
MNAKTKLLGAAALGLMVAACGTDPRERTTGGAAAGAATGAGIGALGGPPGVLAGAAIGGGVGAVTGATTDPSDVNLGRPVWNDPQARIPGVTNSGSTTATGAAAGGGGSYGASTTRQAQSALNSRGYDVGQVDGVMGPRTSRAVREFQQSNNLPATGRLDRETLSALNVSGEQSMRGSSNRNGAYMGGGMVGGTQTSQRMTNPDRSGVATDADPGTGGTGGSGGSARAPQSPNYGGTTPTTDQERRGAATGADPGTGGTGGSGGGSTGMPRGPGVSASPSAAGGPLERSGRATDADPGTGGTGGSGGGATGIPRR